ncbi:MAG: GNAT family N-acetyltransferase [Pseudonocardiaceae bacterium]
MTAVTTELGGQPLDESLFDPICDLYADTFSVPPFAWDDHESERQRDNLRQLLGDPTFGLAVARIEGDELVGFVYGVRVPPNTRRWQGFVTPLAPELPAEWEGRTFAVVDMAVRHGWRGQGIGRRLLQTLLTSRHEERATLTVEPAAEATQGFYRHLGWQHVGRKRTSEGFFIPFFDVYVLPLAS